MEPEETDPVTEAGSELAPRLDPSEPEGDNGAVGVATGYPCAEPDEGPEPEPTDDPEPTELETEAEGKDGVPDEGPEPIDDPSPVELDTEPEPEGDDDTPAVAVEGP